MADRGRRFGKKITNMHWIEGGFSFAAFGAGTVAGTATAAQHLPETLLRTRGEWAATFDAAQGPGSGVFLTLGLIQVPEGTGTTVLWSPATDSDAPWIWWDVFTLLYEEMVLDVIGTQGTLSRARVIDSKAMRRLRNTELQWVAENTTITGHGAAGVNAAGSARFLAGS